MTLVVTWQDRVQMQYAAAAKRFAGSTTVLNFFSLEPRISLPPWVLCFAGSMAINLIYFDLKT